MYLLISTYNRRGLLIWTDTIAGSYGGHDFATALAIDHSGNIIVCGSIAGPGSEGNNMLVVKYAPSGTELWRYSHDYNGNNEGAADLCIDQDNGIYVTGATHLSSGYADMLTIKIDSTSSLIWEETYDFNQLHDIGVKIALSGPRAVVTGIGQYNALTWQATALSYLQADGDLTGTSNSGSADPGVEEISDLTVDVNGNIYLAGSTINGASGYDMLLIKLDEDLNLEWIRDMVYDLMGKEILNLPVSQYKDLISVDLRECSSGIYFIATYSDSSVISTKVIKK